MLGKDLWILWFQINCESLATQVYIAINSYKSAYRTNGATAKFNSKYNSCGLYHKTFVQQNCPLHSNCKFTKTILWA